MARRPGLGRGLNALIPGDSNEVDPSATTTSSNQGISQIPIGAIKPNPHQPRTAINPADLADLSQSITEHGILQPLIVSRDPDSDGFILIAGERRWRAAQLAGLSFVPAIERTITEQGQLELALIENVQRADLNPLELADAYQQLADQFSLTHEEIAERVGKSRTSITNTLRLLNLSDDAYQSLATNQISEGHARALLGLPSKSAQDAALRTVLSQALNVRQTEALVRKLSGERPPRQAKPEPAPEIKSLETRLRNHFGTKVHLNQGKKGGNLVIYYYSDEELNAILDQILPE